MSMSVWNDVLEGTFDTETDNSYEAEVESVVTHEPETMVAYVAQCTEGMLAVECAVATMEGKCAVQYLQGQKEEATATMEGVLRNAWETLKEWVKKAYNAIKKFIKKAWNKMKGYINVFRGMVTKYNYILKGKVDSTLSVDWVEIRMERGADVVNDAIDHAAEPEARNKAYHDLLEKAFFPDGRQVKPKKWSAVASEAIKVADDGFDKVYSEAFKLGELTERDMLKEISDDEKTLRDENEKDKNKTRREQGERNINKVVRWTTNVVRTYSAMVNTAAALKVRLSVKACRKAIRSQAESSSATYGAESTDFSAVMAELI